MKRTFKSFGIELKDVTKEGKVTAVIATLGVIDKDGDITLPGFFGKQDCMIVPAHDWKHVPLGKGVVREVGDKAVCEMQFNLEIQAAKDWHSALMFDLEHGKPKQEWSYGFTVKEGGSSDGGQDALGQKAYRTLRPCPDGMPGCEFHEASPVMVGAGTGTGTLSVKALKLCDEIETALKAAEDLVTRAASLADLRAKEGRGLSPAVKESLAKLRERLKAADAALAAVTHKDDEARKAARVELSRSLAIEAGIYS